MQSEQTILARVNEIFIDVLDDEDIQIVKATTADDVEDWDSLSHIQLIVAIEKDFNIRFTADEIESYSNVGEMCSAILARVSE